MQRVSLLANRYFVCVPVDGDKVDIFTLACRKLGRMKVRGREWEMNRAAVISPQMPKSVYSQTYQGTATKEHVDPVVKDSSCESLEMAQTGRWNVDALSQSAFFLPHVCSCCILN